MRPTLVVVLACVILGGVKWFLDAHSPISPARRQAEIVAASGEYTVELTTTFDAGPDEFGLDDVSSSPSLLVQLDGEEIMNRADTVLASDTPIIARANVIVGVNEFFVQASPLTSDLAPRSIRIRILRDGNPIADETIWPEPGDILQGTVSLEVSES